MRTASPITRDVEGTDPLETSPNHPLQEKVGNSAPKGGR